MFEDVQWPTHCPALGVELSYARGGGLSPLAPSFDRIDPALGYVPGNVAIISFRANSIKQNASPEEIRAVASWLEAVSNPSSTATIAR